MLSKKMLKTSSPYGKEYLEYLTNRGFIKNGIRRIYLNHIRKYLKGLTIDFGCGAGEFLKQLPPGSKGLEINPDAVKYCKGQSLNVGLYLPKEDNYSFINVKKGIYESFAMCHVLEHIEDASEILKKILKACQRMEIEKIVLVVPGRKGFLSDRTHKTFIDLDYLKNKDLLEYRDYWLGRIEYFPLNIKTAGNWLTHNESIFIYEKKRQTT